MKEEFTKAGKFGGKAAFGPKEPNNAGFPSIRIRSQVLAARPKVIPTGEQSDSITSRNRGQ